jgi:hypothetical protein
MRGTIVEVCELDYSSKPVYNLGVSGDHSYVAGGFVVHNCDYLEQADLYGYGEGLYHPAAVPSLIHPHCQCRVETVLKDPEDYGTGNRDLPDEADLDAGDVGEAMRGIEGDRTVTETYAENQTEMLQDQLDAAREVAPGLMG